MFSSFTLSHKNYQQKLINYGNKVYKTQMRFQLWTNSPNSWKEDIVPWKSFNNTIWQNQQTVTIIQIQIIHSEIIIINQITIIFNQIKIIIQVIIMNFNHFVTKIQILLILTMYHIEHNQTIHIHRHAFHVLVGSHPLRMCEQFRSFNPTKRRAFIQNKNLCMNCLGTGHNLSECIKHSHMFYL